MAEKMVVVKKNLGNDRFFYYSFVIDDEIDFDKYYHVDSKILKNIVHDKEFVDKNCSLEKFYFYAIFWGFDTIYMWDIDKECWYSLCYNVQAVKKRMEEENTWIKQCGEFLYQFLDYLNKKNTKKERDFNEP